MYKVVIVDDEKQILDGLTHMIKWSELGFEVCATARNGVEAIPKIKEHKADLVLTDIRMPKMDGLMLLEYVRENLPKDIEFIILSGYSEFEYAQKAMRFNVKNYILKPIDEALLYGTLMDVKQVLEEKEIRRSLKIQSYINNIISGESFSASELDLEREEVYGLRYITIEKHFAFHSLSWKENAGEEDLFTAISEKIETANMRFILRQDKNKCQMVVGQSLLQCFAYDPKLLAQSLFDYLLVQKGIPVDIYIGQKVKGFKDLHQSIQSVSVCRNVRFFKEEAAIIVYEEIKEYTFLKIFEDNGAIIRTISAFKKNDMEQFKKAIHDLAHQFQKMKVMPEIILVHLDSIMASIMQMLSERTDNTREVIDKYTSYKKIQGKASLNELINLVIEFCCFCNTLSLEEKNKENLDIVGKVMNYVHENYMKPLKIIDIAEAFFVNPAYLGQQFIKKKNMSLNYYINTVRLEKSKELLLNTNLKIYEIAIRVGFDDPNYFSAKFYEYTSQKPSEFRSLKESF